MAACGYRDFPGRGSSLSSYADLRCDSLQMHVRQLLFDIGTLFPTLVFAMLCGRFG